MTEKTSQEEFQEEEYSFPYHYVTRFHPVDFRQHFVDTWGVNYASTMHFLLERLQKHKLSSIIDVGCGDGRFSREMALNLNIKKVVGIDYSKKAVTLARTLNADTAKLEFRDIDIIKNPPAEKFDAAILMEVFEHIPLDTAGEFMASVARLLKPGGKLFLTVPHVNKPVEYKHFQHFTVESLLSYMTSHFEIDEVVMFEKRGLRRKLMKFCLSNHLFVLNNRKLLNMIYHWQKNNLFYCDQESQCQRIFVEASTKNND